jgi:cyanophycin synthetase
MKHLKNLTKQLNYNFQNQSLLELAITHPSFSQTKTHNYERLEFFGDKILGTIIADYGHNPDAVQALVQAIESMPATKRTVVISGAGDRRDEDISRQTEILGEIFDEAILYQDQCQRGREDGEVLALLQLGLKHVSRTKEIQEIRGEFLAIDTALAKLQPGQLCLILIDQVQEALDHIAKRIAESR